MTWWPVGLNVVSPYHMTSRVCPDVIRPCIFLLLTALPGLFSLFIQSSFPDHSLMLSSCFCLPQFLSVMIWAAAASFHVHPGNPTGQVDLQCFYDVFFGVKKTKQLKHWNSTSIRRRTSKFRRWKFCYVFQRFFDVEVLMQFRRQTFFLLTFFLLISMPFLRRKSIEATKYCCFFLFCNVEVLKLI